MRRLKPLLTGTVFVALLSGLGGTVAAQDDLMAPAMVTGTATMLSHDSSGVSSFPDGTLPW